ncbi:MAG: cutinase family protein [Microbacteriaceae bacterium]|nr:cutinase family protein [Microbacteriaceae bacterium]MCL2793992.1 cutinase family protein [Microbacteriaceae bacterium]
MSAAAALLALALSAAPVAAFGATPAPHTPQPAAAATPGGAAARASAARTCPAYEFVGARGSGEDNGIAESKRYTAKNPTYGMGGEVADVYRRVAETAQAAGVQLVPFGVPYPAVGIDVVSGATLSTGSLGVYTKSVELGAHAAAAEIERVARSCASTQVIVAGYSQGAQALVDAVQSLTPGARAHVVAAVFFGNTYFTASNPRDDYGSYDPDLDGYLAHAGVLPSGQGAGAASGTDWTKAFGGAAIFDYCHDGDPICGLVDERTVDDRSFPVRDFAHIVAASSIDGAEPNILTDHTTYLRGDTANAAQQLRQLLGLPLAPSGGAPRPALTSPHSQVAGTEFTINAGGTLSDPVDPIVTYRWTTDPGTVGSHVVSTADPLFTTSFLNPGTHVVRLETLTASGEKGTATASITITPAPTSAPAQPTDVQAIAGDGAVTVTWPDTTGAEFYAVADASGRLLTAFTPLVPGQSPVSWTDSGLRNDREQAYRVYAVNGMGRSIASATVTATPRAASDRPVTAPVKLPVPAVALVEPELTWSVGLGLIAIVLAIGLISSPRSLRR